MNTEQARYNMIEQQVRPWDVLDASVLELLAVVKREDFVPAAHRALAFADIELPIGEGQCMLSPKVEARLLQELAVRRHERVLEIGTGSGYMAALLGHKAQHVLSLEIRPRLAAAAAARLERAAVATVSVRVADGARPLAANDGPFDAILLSGSVASVPDALLELLRPGGRLAAIVGQLPVMQALLVTRTAPDALQRVSLFETVAPRLDGFGEPSAFRF